MQHLQLPGTYSLGRQRTLPPALQTHAAVLAADEGVLREVLGGPVPPGPWARPPQVLGNACLCRTESIKMLVSPA